MKNLVEQFAYTQGKQGGFHVVASTPGFDSTLRLPVAFQLPPNAVTKEAFLVCRLPSGQWLAAKKRYLDQDAESKNLRGGNYICHGCLLEANTDPRRLMGLLNYSGWQLDPSAIALPSATSILAACEASEMRRDLSNPAELAALRHILAHWMGQGSGMHKTVIFAPEEQALMLRLLLMGNQVLPPGLAPGMNFCTALHSLTAYESEWTVAATAFDPPSALPPGMRRWGTIEGTVDPNLDALLEGWREAMLEGRDWREFRDHPIVAKEKDLRRVTRYLRWYRGDAQETAHDLLFASARELEEAMHLVGVEAFRLVMTQIEREGTMKDPGRLGSWTDALRRQVSPALTDLLPKPKPRIVLSASGSPTPYQQCLRAIRDGHQQATPDIVAALISRELDGMDGLLSMWSGWVLAEDANRERATACLEHIAAVRETDIEELKPKALAALTARLAPPTEPRALVQVLLWCQHQVSVEVAEALLKHILGISPKGKLRRFRDAFRALKGLHPRLVRIVEEATPSGVLDFFG